MDVIKEKNPNLALPNREVQDQFLHSLHLGTGQAMLILRDYPELDFSSHLIYAACNNLANDPQSEGSRADYVFKLIQRSRQKQFIVAQVLRKLKNKKNDYWGLDQLYDLALLFHRAGFAQAREVFLHRFEKNSLAGYEFCGDEQILRMDGVAGLLRLAEVAGMRHEWDKESISRWVIDDFQEENKAIDVYGELAQAAKSNPSIQNYLDQLNNEAPSNEAPSVRPKRKRMPLAYSWDEVLKRINTTSRNCSFNAKLAAQMDQLIVDALAREFLSEKDLLKKAKYLRFFSVRKFPFDYAPILKIARGKIIANSRLVPNAVQALSFFAGDDIRRLAMEKLASEEKPDEYILLLQNNFQADDITLLLRLIYRSDDFDQVHRLIRDLLSLFHANPQIDCELPLLAMYARMNCGMHRSNLLDLLHERRHALPEVIFRELEYDSYDGVRKLYRKIKRERQRASTDCQAIS